MSVVAPPPPPHIHNNNNQPSNKKKQFSGRAVKSSNTRKTRSRIVVVLVFSPPLALLTPPPLSAIQSARACAPRSSIWLQAVSSGELSIIRCVGSSGLYQYHTTKRTAAAALCYTTTTTTQSGGSHFLLRSCAYANVFKCACFSHIRSRTYIASHSTLVSSSAYNMQVFKCFLCVQVKLRESVFSVTTPPPLPSSFLCSEKPPPQASKKHSRKNGGGFVRLRYCIKSVKCFSSSGVV